MNSEKAGSSHSNNFNLLRLILAILVVFSHSFLFTRGEAVEPMVLFTMGQATFGVIAVDGFFIISGFLITQSFLRSKTTGEFLVKRALRIYPGYYGAIVFTFAIGAIGSYPSHLFYIKHTFTSYGTQLVGSLLLPSSSFLDRDYTFRNNPHSSLTNGSLWTLAPELYCYALTAFAGLFGILRHKYRLLFLLIFFLIMNCIYLKLLHRSNDVLWRFGLNFAFGACYSQFYDRMPVMTLRSAALCILAICIAARFTNLFNIAYTLFGGYCLIGIGMTKTFRGTSFQNRFDLSYGIYLYACPLQQLLVFLCSIGSPYVLFIAAMPPVSLMAYLSWSLIESPAMQLRQKLLCYIK